MKINNAKHFACNTLIIYTVIFTMIREMFQLNIARKQTFLDMQTVAQATNVSNQRNYLYNEMYRQCMLN